MVLNSIYIIGFMASGKTKFGKKLAKAMDMNFVDLDVLIEENEDLSINEIFETKGEEYFRALESEIIDKLDFENTIISLGGGTPCYNNNLEKIKAKGKVIYLELPLKILIGRLKKDKENRPLVKNLSEIELTKTVKELFEEREVFYKKADLSLDMNLSFTKLKNSVINLETN